MQGDRPRARDVRLLRRLQQFRNGGQQRLAKANIIATPTPIRNAASIRSASRKS
jgi:hypothetical protein